MKLELNLTEHQKELLHKRIREENWAFCRSLFPVQADEPIIIEVKHECSDRRSSPANPS
jgi:hypothetical protein